MWNVTPSNLWDWTALKAEIKKHGVRNSLLLAPMPTASTSQILGNNECFEPYTSNIYQRRVLAGEFQVVNPWLLRDLVEMGLWSDNMKNRIIAEGGSIQNIASIPQDIKALYKTVWEISQRTIVQMAADRGAFIDQSQSLNIHMREPTMGKITSMHFAGWKMGLKTGMYYLRTQAAAQPIQFTVDQEALKATDDQVAPAHSGLKKRAPPAGTYTSIVLRENGSGPRPYAQTGVSDTSTPNGTKDIPTPTSTPPPTTEAAEALVQSDPRPRPLVSPAKTAGFKADFPEPESPKALATEPIVKTEAIGSPLLEKKEGQNEDKDDENEKREGDIYDSKVIACAIDNPEACEMCSG
jgi:ribonucleoside-diphosphate reductase subunit M1